MYEAMFTTLTNVDFDLSRYIEMVLKAGEIRHFLFIGSCDDAKLGRNYFTEFADSVPDGSGK